MSTDQEVLALGFDHALISLRPEPGVEAVFGMMERRAAEGSPTERPGLQLLGEVTIEALCAPEERPFNDLHEGIRLGAEGMVATLDEYGRREPMFGDDLDDLQTHLVLEALASMIDRANAGEDEAERMNQESGVKHAVLHFMAETVIEALTAPQEDETEDLHQGIRAGAKGVVFVLTEYTNRALAQLKPE